MEKVSQAGMNPAHCKEVSAPDLLMSISGFDGTVKMDWPRDQCAARCTSDRYGPILASTSSRSPASQATR